MPKASDPDFDLANRDSVRSVVAAVLAGLCHPSCSSELRWTRRCCGLLRRQCGGDNSPARCHRVAATDATPGRRCEQRERVRQFHGRADHRGHAGRSGQSLCGEQDGDGSDGANLRRSTTTRHHAPVQLHGCRSGEPFFVPKLVAHFAERRPSIELGNLDVVRDFSDVRGIAEAYVRLLTAEVSGGITNLCSGVGHPLRWILQQLSELSGHELELKVNESFVRTSEVHRLVGSNAIMRAALLANFRSVTSARRSSRCLTRGLHDTLPLSIAAVMRQTACPRRSRPTTSAASLRPR